MTFSIEEYEPDDEELLPGGEESFIMGNVVMLAFFAYCFVPALFG